MKSIPRFPASVVSGGTSHGTVTLEYAVPTDAVVGLAVISGGGGLPLPGSNASPIATVPPSMTIPAGHTTGGFMVKTQHFSAPPLHENVSIMAAAVTQKYAMLDYDILEGRKRLTIELGVSRNLMPVR